MVPVLMEELVKDHIEYKRKMHSDFAKKSLKIIEIGIIVLGLMAVILEDFSFIIKEIATRILRYIAYDVN